MSDFFFYGTLCHAPLLACVLGREADAEPATLPGYAAHWAEGQSYPVLVPAGAAGAEGVLVRGLGPQDLDRLNFYAGGFARAPRTVEVQTATGPAMAQVFLSGAETVPPGAPWRLEDWRALWGDIVLATADEVMSLYGRAPVERVQARYAQMLVRGSSRARARADGPTTLRRRARPEDVAVSDRRQPYANFFAVEEYDLSFRRFDGSFSPTVTRAVFLSGDAVTVLPYDPVRDRVLLVEQFRVGPMARGEPQAWALEAIAGRIDPGESPETAARREAEEEAGLTLGALLPVADYYPSSGAKSEYLYSYVALCDLPDGAAGVFGVEGEAEDIRGHLVSFDRLMELVAAGEASNAPLILTALWLQRERPRLRGV